MKKNLKWALGSCIFLILGIGLIGLSLTVLIEPVNGQWDPAYDPWGLYTRQYPFTEMYVPQPKQGDVNRDGAINHEDIMAICNLIKWGHLADVNADNKIDQKDINYLTNYLYYNSGEAPKDLTRCRPITIKRACFIFRCIEHKDKCTKKHLDKCLKTEGM